MSPTSFLSRLIRGWSRQPFKGVARIFAVYCTLWALYNPLGTLIFNQPQAGHAGVVKYAILVVLAILIGGGTVALPGSAKIKIPGCNTFVTITTGDLLKFNGHKVIAVNEFFDSKIGDHVSSTSLHGKVITHYFGDPAKFEQEVDANLTAQNCQGVVVQRTSGRVTRYAIGTTAVVPWAGHRLFLPALCHTDIQTLQATARPEDLLVALTSAWQAVRRYGSGDPVAIPLMGSGLSGVNLPYIGILDMILLSIVSESKSREITKDIHIILTEQAFSAVDLSALIREWQ